MASNLIHQVSGEDGPEMPCVKYVYGECPFWCTNPGFYEMLVSIISQMDDITVTEDLISSAIWNTLTITGTIHGNPELIKTGVNGYVFEAENVAQLAQCLVDTIGDVPPGMSEKAFDTHFILQNLKLPFSC